MKISWMKVVIAVAIAGLLISGCAKKPAIDEETAGTRDESTTTTTEMPSRDLRGIDERAVTDTRAADRDQAADSRRMGEGVPELQRIFFEFDQYTLSPDAQDILQDNATYLKNNPSVDVRIEGHADERGSDEYNLALGERRALAAKNYLVSLGIDPRRMTIISYGEEMPLEYGTTEEAWSKNRRAEFKEVR